MTLPYKKPELFIRTEYHSGVPHDLVFWSPNMKTFPVTHLPERDTLTEYYVSKDLQTLHWSLNTMPHIMFTPLTVKFQGPLFDRLSVSRKTLPLVRIGNLWYLSPDVGHPWQRLEIALTAIAHTLYDKGRTLFSLGYDHRFPESYGYTKGHLEADVARRCAMKSRDGFIELIGLCSHAITLYGPHWVDVLAENPKVYHPAWVDTLAKSVVCDFGVERAGVIVDPSSCEWLRWIPRLSKTNVPIYILWGSFSSDGKPMPTSSQAPHVKLHPPTNDDVIHFWRDYQDALAWNSKEIASLSPVLHDGEDTDMALLSCPDDHLSSHDINGFTFRLCDGPTLQLPTEFPLRLSDLSVDIAPNAVCDASTPSHANVDFSLPLPSPPSHANVDFSLSLPSPPTKSNDRLPQPYTNSGQLKGETWVEFFQRRDAKNLERMRTETAKQKQRRESRAFSAKAHNIPKSAKVYRWIPDDDTGFLLRELLYSGRVEMWWSSYADTQRRYDPFMNEWDLCEEFDPEAVPDDDSDDDFAVDGDYLAPQTTLSTLPEEMLLEDLDDVYHPEIQSDPLEITSSLIAALHGRYGFSPSQPSTKITTLTWKQARAIITDSESHVDSTLQASILEFLESFMNSPSKVSVPSSLWDLHPMNHAYLRRTSPVVAFQPLRVCVGTDTTSRTYYSIHPPYSYSNLSDLVKRSNQDSGNSSWLLLVGDPATVVQCLRSKWGPFKNDITKCLVERGMSFSTIALVPNQPVAPERKPLVNGLGYRNKGYMPSPVDYVLYEEERNNFLSHGLIRAALLRGGILWRLAREKLQNLGDAVEVITNGPTEMAYFTGQRFYIEGLQFSDDKLSEEEEGLICGVYRVRTENLSWKDQTSDMSWWPKPSAWEKSGLNVGYWSPDCESWYQRRLQLIRDGKATLRTAAEWRDAMKLQKKARILTDANATAAAKFLSGHVFV